MSRTVAPTSVSRPVTVPMFSLKPAWAIPLAVQVIDAPTANVACGHVIGPSTSSLRTMVSSGEVPVLLTT